MTVEVVYMECEFFSAMWWRAEIFKDMGCKIVSYAAIVGWVARFFFFQAEDGIRDTSVTGVQTCALPILSGMLMLALYRSGRQAEALEAYRAARHALVDGLGIEPSPDVQELEQAILRQDPEQIGRASCRERVEISDGVRAVERKTEERKWL